MNSPHHAPAIYDSAVDGWVKAMLSLTPLVSLAFGIAFLVQGEAGDASIIFLAGVVSVIVTALFTMPCRYTLLDDTLNIRCGILCYSIPLDDIQSAELSSSWQSGPALSLKRIRITTAKRSYLISPKSRETFLEDLNRRRHQ